MSDMEEMIKKEISRISGLKERVVFKDIIEQLFLSLYETNQEMYHELESRVMDDLIFDINRYQITMGIIEREYMDPSHHLLSPMREEDICAPKPEKAEILVQLRESGRCLVKTYFMEYDYLGIEKLLARKRIGGRIWTDTGSYPAEFEVCRKEEYLREISRLYEVFVSNGVPWQTVNVPYLYKFIDVYLTQIPEEAVSDKTITKIEPDLEEFAQWAREDFVPIWNIRKLRMDSVGFPVPCEDHRSYEHTISIREYGNEHVYLIDDAAHIHSIRQKENRLIIMGEEAEARKWNVYMIRNGHNRRFDRYTYPLMTNQRKDEFLERFGRRQGARVRTEGELSRFIQGYGMETYVEYEGYEILDRENCAEPSETYSMNSFILDEIRENEYKKRLILLFRKKGAQIFLLRDIMSFLVSEVQLMYGEYMCEGRLI
ncbi:MAG: hypothetical protein K2J99_17050 [Lachnospiraceae bacterium]|nr:hypothetical protein [Lachnospiraceae bacterium]